MDRSRVRSVSSFDLNNMHKTVFARMDLSDSG